jgi:hypothetical protein
MDGASRKAIVRGLLLQKTRRKQALRRDGAWLHGAPPNESDPLVHYIFNEFRQVAEVGEFKFLVAKESLLRLALARP